MLTHVFIWPKWVGRSSEAWGAAESCQSRARALSSEASGSVQKADRLPRAQPSINRQYASSSKYVDIGFPWRLRT